MSLCRHYVRELRRSVLISTPDLDKSGSKRSSQILDYMQDMHPNDNLNVNQFDEKNEEQRLSAYLRTESSSNIGMARQTGQGQPSGFNNGNHNNINGNNNNGISNAPIRPPFLDTPEQTSSGSPAHTVARADIRASAEKILYTYLLRGSEREIVLPEQISTSIAHFIEVDGRDDPEVFDEAKDYVFQAMERDAFPGFLRAKALGNLVPPSSLVRLILGLLGMFGGFWAGFCLIFLDIHPRVTRLWVRETTPFFCPFALLFPYQQRHCVIAKGRRLCANVLLSIIHS